MIGVCVITCDCVAMVQEVLRSSHRITSLMTSGDQLWVGTGGGRVLVLTYAQNVPDTREAIRSLVKQKSLSTEATPTSQSTDRTSGGLLNTSTDGTAGAETPEEEKWVDIQGSPTPSHYQKRRKTQFGKTLRNKSHKHYRRKGVPDIYRLQFLTCGQMISDSVRVLLPFR